MAKRCPPGVICIENMSFIFLIIATTLAILIYLQLKVTNTSSLPPLLLQTSWFNRFLNHQAFPQSVLLNPYTPPLSNTRFFSSNLGYSINIPTSSVNASYRQVGILTRLNGVETILPIMGRPLHANRNKWQYYTMSDKNNSVKLPVSRNGRSCTSEYGCDSLYNGDNVFVEGYNDAFKVTIYDNDTPHYIPFI